MLYRREWKWPIINVALSFYRRDIDCPNTPSVGPPTHSWVCVPTIYFVNKCMCAYSLRTRVRQLIAPTWLMLFGNTPDDMQISCAKLLGKQCCMGGTNLLASGCQQAAADCSWNAVNADLSVMALWFFSLCGVVAVICYSCRFFVFAYASFRKSFNASSFRMAVWPFGKFAIFT